MVAVKYLLLVSLRRVHLPPTSPPSPAISINVHPSPPSLRCCHHSHASSSSSSFFMSSFFTSYKSPPSDRLPSYLHASPRMVAVLGPFTRRPSDYSPRCAPSASSVFLGPPPPPTPADPAPAPAPATARLILLLSLLLLFCCYYCFC